MKKVLIVLLTLTMVIFSTCLNVCADGSGSNSNQPITVMSFNVKVETFKNGRDDLVIATIQENAPRYFWRSRG